MIVRRLLLNPNILVIAKFLVILNIFAIIMGLLYFGIQDESIFLRISWMTLAAVLPLTLFYCAKESTAKGDYYLRVVFSAGLVAHTVEIGKRVAYRVSDIDIGIALLFCLAYLLVWRHILRRAAPIATPGNK